MAKLLKSWKHDGEVLPTGVFNIRLFKVPVGYELVISVRDRNNHVEVSAVFPAENTLEICRANALLDESPWKLFIPTELCQITGLFRYISYDKDELHMLFIHREFLT